MLIQMPLFRLAPDADQVVQYHQKNMGAELRCEVNYFFFGAEIVGIDEKDCGI